MKIQVLKIALFFLFLSLVGQNNIYAQRGGGNYGAIGVAQPISANNSGAIAIPQSIKSNSRRISTHQGNVQGTRFKYKIGLDKNAKISHLELYNKKGRPSNAKVIFVICGKSNKSLEMTIGTGKGTYYVSVCQGSEPKIEYIP